MEESELTVLLRLLVAHLFADFVLQSDHWVEDRKTNRLRSKYFWMHIAVVAVTTYVLLADWTNWQVPCIVAATHLIIDIIKTSVSKDTTTALVLDQIAHLLVIGLVWLGMTDQWEHAKLLVDHAFNDQRVWLVVLGYLINSVPLAVLIRYLTRRWNYELTPTPETNIQEAKLIGLTDAGKWIGILERVLIFTLVLFDELPAIGFLLTAKSVFRFGDLKDGTDRKRTEYILIGTLISFASSILVSLLVVKLLR